MYRGIAFGVSAAHHAVAGEHSKSSPSSSPRGRRQYDAGALSKFDDQYQHAAERVNTGVGWPFLGVAARQLMLLQYHHRLLMKEIQ